MSNREQMHARAKQWLALVAQYRKARPNASYGWAEQKAKEEDPELHALVHGLPMPWDQPGAEVLPETPAPARPLFGTRFTTPAPARPTSGFRQVRDARTSTTPAVTFASDGKRADVATLRKRFEAAQLRMEVLKAAAEFEERLGTPTPEQTQGLPKGYQIRQESDEDGTWHWAYAPYRTLGGFATKQEALVAVLTDARRAEANRRAALSRRPSGDAA